MRRQRPDRVTSPASPWYGYLTAVYGRPPTLPFALDRLNFFYHHDDTWPRHVEWPMAPCMSTRTPVVDAAMPPCRNATQRCARWSSDEAELGHGRGTASS